MLDRKACKKMWVWDGNRSNPKDRQRIVIDIFSDGGCRVVADDYENTFYESDDYYDASFYDHCEEITESKPRAFKDDFRKPCKWQFVATEDYWQTECGEAFTFIADGPAENHYNYCLGCGRKIEMKG